MLGKHRHNLLQKIKLTIVAAVDMLQLRDVLFLHVDYAAAAVAHELDIQPGIHGYRHPAPAALRQLPDFHGVCMQ